MRAGQYGVSGIPHVQFGGTISSIGGGGNMYPSYLQKYNQLINYNSPLEIELMSTTIGGELVTQANIEVTGNISTINNKVLFILVRYQDDDYFSSVVGFDDMTFNLNNTGETGQFENSVAIDPSWDIETLKSVVLVQSWNNDQIIQGSMMEISLDNMFSLNCGFEDILSDNDGDGVVNPGETIHVPLSIVNESLEISAENVMGMLSTENPFVTISPTTIQVNNAIENGDGEWFEIAMTFDAEIPLGTVPFTFSVSAEYVDIYGNPGEFNRDYTLEIDVSLFQKNWPHLTFNQIESSPAVVDIDNDGAMEVIYGEYGGLVHMVDEMGNEQPGFPIDLDNDIWGSPAVADMEGDGDMEIVIGSKDKHLLIINPDGSIQADYNAQQYIMATPALGDIDGDGELEALFGGYSSPGKLFAVNADGSAVSGFPIALGEKIQRGVALADFNGDGLPEIVVGTDDEMIHVLYGDGTEAPGFPFEAENDFRTAPSVIDINGEKVIVAGNRDDNFYGINSDGTLRFIVETGGDVSTSAGFGSTPWGLGIFFGSDDGYVYGVDVNGESLPNWPQFVEDDVICSPVVVDIDGDGEVEIVTAVDGTKLYAFHVDGSMVHHFPIHYGDFPFKGSPAVVDMDSDGDLEVMIGTARSIVNVDIKESSQSLGYWNMHRGNLRRTGYYEAPVTGDVTVEVSHSADWNLVGLPVGLTDTGQASVYPDAIEGTLFSFVESYVQQEHLESGIGYWLRFNEAGSNSITGTPITFLNLSLQSDWNLISGLSSTFNVSDISDPGGIIIPGTVFGFGESYELADALEPGRAYWLRTTSAGDVELGVSPTSRTKESPQIQGNRLMAKGMTLYFGLEVENKLNYSVPPLPPEGVFDIRFSDDSRVCLDDCEVELRQTGGETEMDCRIEDGSQWELVDALGRVRPCTEDMIMDVSGTETYTLRRVSSVVGSFSLSPAYPNPFNPETTIEFTLQEAREMTITIHDILGRQVVELVSGEVTSGHHTLVWDGRDTYRTPMSGGVYFLRVHSGNTTDIMKLILLK